MRHIPNLRMYARGRPQIRHRLWNRTWNFALCFQRSMADFFAKFYLRNGMPSLLSKLRASSSLRAVVTIETSSPRSLSILS